MPPPPEPCFLLVDVNAMFCAVAARVDPAGAGAAPYLIVGGGGGERGVVCSASYSARAKGVRSGMSLLEARVLVPTAMVVPVPRIAVAEAARDLRMALQEWSPVMVPASVDECYLDMTGWFALWGPDIETVAARIRDDVLSRTGLPVSIGGGETPWLAKIAAEFAKPHRGGSGVSIIPFGGGEAAVAELALATLPGVGSTTARRLNSLGLTTVKDFKKQSADTLMQWLGVVDAEKLSRWARGDNPAPLRGITMTPQIGRETTFGTNVSSWRALQSRLRTLSSDVAYEARAHPIRMRTVTVVLRDSTFQTKQVSQTVKNELMSDDELFDVALTLLARIRTALPGPIRLIGVRVKGPLKEGVPAQVSSRAVPVKESAPSDDGEAESPPTERDHPAIEEVDDHIQSLPSHVQSPTHPSQRAAAVSAVLDSIRQRHGPEALRWASAAVKESPRASREVLHAPTWSDASARRLTVTDFAIDTRPEHGAPKE